MKVSFGQLVRDFNRQARKRRVMFSVILVLSMFVSTGIVWRLRSVGLTMVNEVNCGINEHTHDESCYEKQLVCTLDETEDSDLPDEVQQSGHMHDDSCYEMNIVCEKAEHVHSIRCCDNALAVEKKEDEGEIPVVEILKDDTTDSEFCEAAESVSDSEENNENDNSINENSEEYDDVLQKLLGRRTNASLNTSMGLVNSPQNGVVYIYRNGQHYSIDSSPYVMKVGESEYFCVHGDNLSNEYAYSSGNMPGVTVSNKVDISNNNERIAEIKANSVAEVSVFVAFDNNNNYGIDFPVKVVANDSGTSSGIELVKSDGSKVSDPGSVYTAENPYEVSVGEKFDVYGYGESGSDNWFYCSFVTDNNETATFNYNNDTISNDSSGRKIKSEFTAVQAAGKDSNGKPVPTKIIFEDQSFYVLVRANEESSDKIYVVTALGEREKDRINEYLDGGAYAHTVQSNHKSDDGLYLKNSADFPYIIYVGETVELSHYSSKQDQYFWYADSNGTYIATDEFLRINNAQSNTDDGKWRMQVNCTAVSAARLQIHVDGSNEIFYLEIRSYDGEQRDHSDIEITDGGFYEFRKEEEYTVSGQKMITVERYDTHITGVNHCYLYASDGSIINTYVTSDYRANGTVGSTQYELTSKFSERADKKFDRNRVYAASFDVSMTLIPSTKTVTIVDSSGNVIGSPVVTNISGGASVEISSAIFNLSQRSVIDAHNKCPDHSGLDFNVSACLNNIVTNVEFTATKNFTDLNNRIKDGFTREFTFELVDNNDTVVGTAVNDENGNIVFGNVFLPEGDYEYTIREKIDSDAIDINGKKYDQGSGTDPNGVYYDQSDVVYKVKVSNSQGIIKSQYVKTVNGNEEVISNFDGAFTNEVVDERYSDVTVEKKWSDGSVPCSEIKFRLYRTDDEGNKVQISVGGVSEFIIKSSDNWKIHIGYLPLEMAGHTYSYEMEEINIPDGYLAGYSTAGSDWSIINSPKNNISVTVKKEWYDMDGNSFEKKDGTYILYNLIREVRTTGTPLCVRIQDSSGNTVAEHTFYTTNGGSVEFKVNPSAGIEIDYNKSKNISNYSFYNDAFHVFGVQDDALLVLKGGSQNTDYYFELVSSDAGTECGTWIRDCIVLENQRLDYSVGWTHTFTRNDLENALIANGKTLVKDGCEYRYIVDEPRLVGYEEPVYINNGVAANTPDTPIIIQNKQLQSYLLPPTGGEGTGKYTVSGIILVSGATAFIIYRKRKKRRSGA